MKEEIITMTKTCLIGLIIIGIIVAIMFPIIHDYTNKQVIAIEIKDKYIKRNNNTDVYMIVDSDNNTYCITDLFFKGKFNSTDIYNSLEIGQAYLVEVTGVRNRFLSWYQNINKIL